MSSEIILTSTTCWILGAGASFDCIAPGRTCVPLTESLICAEPTPRHLENTLAGGPPNAISRDLRATLQDLLSIGDNEIGTALNTRLEQTVDRLRGVAASPDNNVSVRAGDALKKLLRLIAEAVRWGSIHAHGAFGESLGFIYCAENYMWLADFCQKNQDSSVLSLNYDTLFDMALARINKSDSSPPIQLSFWRRFHQWEIPASGGWQGGAYIKLHGSLDIFSCHNISCPYYRRPVDISGYRKHMSVVAFERMTGMIEPITQQHVACQVCSKEMEPLILPPGANKVAAEDRYHKAIYHMAGGALGACNSWILVGYSCPSYDSDVVELLQRALRLKPWFTRPERSVAVIGPDAIEVADRLQQRIKYPVVACPQSFSDFVDGINRQTGNQRPGLA